MAEPDQWGFRDVLLTSSRRFLDEPRLRSLVARLRHPGWSRSATPAAGLALAIGLAVELADPQLVEELAIARYGEVPLYCRMDIARIHLATGRADTALSWLAAVLESEMRADQEIEELLFDIHSALGNAAECAKIAWRRFRRYRSRYTLDGLLAVIGTPRRNSVVAEELVMIGAAPAFSSSDARFLLEIERFGDAAGYIISRLELIPGIEWHYLAPIAASLAERGFPLAATCVYRALLVSILERKQSKAYHHGADYFLRLKQLDRSITDCQGVSVHAAFEADLRRLHGRKRIFWQQIDG